MAPTRPPPPCWWWGLASPITVCRRCSPGAPPFVIFRPAAASRATRRDATDCGGPTNTSPLSDVCSPSSISSTRPLQSASSDDDVESSEDKPVDVDDVLE